MEAEGAVKRSMAADDGGTSEERSWNFNGPGIQARVSGKSILLKIYCEKRKGILVKVHGEMEKLNLTVVNSSVTPFGSSAFDVTVIAQMDEEINLGTEYIVDTLRSALTTAGYFGKLP